MAAKEEAYGVCLLRRAKGFDAFSVLKHGSIVHSRITLTGGKAEARTLRTLNLATQSEGCVADPCSNTLYVGEEDRGIRAFDASETGNNNESGLVAAVDGAHLAADVEGLALWPQGRRRGWLVVSSQGDNAYALYRLPGFEPAGRFCIAAGTFGSTEETDGIDLAKGNFGQNHPGGSSQDGQNAPAGQIMRYEPSRFEGTSRESEEPGRLDLFVESTDPLVMDYADNVVVAPWGNLIVCEDRTGTKTNHLRGITPEGRTYTIARLNADNELAGACFSPDGSTLFVNVYKPGKTLAVTGPWRAFVG